MFTAVLFLLCYVLCYWVPESAPFFGEIFGPWWHVNGIINSLPMFLALLTLVAGLLAMTMIDARTFTIPIQIPLCMTLVAFAAAIVQSWIMMRHTPDQVWPYPLIDWTWAGAAFGGMIGVIVATALLRCRIVAYSFADYEEYIQGDDVLAVYPHARREMVKELIVVLPIVLGFILGWVLCYERGMPSLAVQGIAGSMLGYLVGGGLVWGIRIVGTLGFGKEAMGLGDVHLLAGVGAVLGWWDPILIFFIAPFSGLLFVAVSSLLEKMGKQFKEIPYGPHLAVATLIVVFCRPAVDWVWSVAMPSVQMPSIQKIQPSHPTVDASTDVTPRAISETQLLWGDLTYGEKAVSIHVTPLPVGYG